MKQGPPDANELAHIMALLDALRLDEWPDDQAQERVIRWMRVTREAWKRKRKSDRDWVLKQAKGER